MRSILFSALVCGASVAGAAGIATPFGMTTTQVLPKGVRSLSISGVNTTVDSWYNNSGAVTGVAEPFNQNLTYARLLKAEPDQNLRLNVESQLKNKGVDLNTVAGRSTADINTRAFVTLPVLAYGVSEKWTLALAVPIVYTNIQVSTGFVGTPQLQQLVSDFAKQSRKQTQTIQQKLTDVIATEISGKGYRPLTNQESTEVGDVRLVAKYLAYKGLAASWALQNTLTLPTAKVREVDLVVDPTPGDGQFDYGINSVVEIPVNARWRLLQELGYTMQFADTRATRIPYSSYERLSSDVDNGARRKLGDIMQASFGAIYSPWDYLSFGGSYTLSYKERDRWWGNLATADRYHALGVETEQYLQALYFQSTASTIAAYQNGEFPVPLMATLGMGRVLDGRNVRSDPVWSLNMTMFF